jgi:hypothetical protein
MATCEPLPAPASRRAEARANVSPRSSRNVTTPDEVIRAGFEPRSAKVSKTPWTNTSQQTLSRSTAGFQSNDLHIRCQGFFGGMRIYLSNLTLYRKSVCDPSECTSIRCGFLPRTRLDDAARAITCVQIHRACQVPGAPEILHSSDVLSPPRGSPSCRGASMGLRCSGTAARPV